MAESVCPIVTFTEFTSEYCHADENALLVPPQNPDALAEAIIHAAGQSAIRERLGARARQSIAAASPIEIAAHQYLNWLGQAPEIGCVRDDDFSANELE